MKQEQIYIPTIETAQDLRGVIFGAPKQGNWSTTAEIARLIRDIADLHSMGRADDAIEMWAGLRGRLAVHGVQLARPTDAHHGALLMFRSPFGMRVVFADISAPQEWAHITDSALAAARRDEQDETYVPAE